MEDNWFHHRGKVHCVKMRLPQHDMTSSSCDAASTLRSRSQNMPRQNSTEINNNEVQQQQQQHDNKKIRHRLKSKILLLVPIVLLAVSSIIALSIEQIVSDQRVAFIEKITGNVLLLYLCIWKNWSVECMLALVTEESVMELKRKSTKEQQTITTYWDSKRQDWTCSKWEEENVNRRLPVNKVPSHISRMHWVDRYNWYHQESKCSEDWHKQTSLFWMKRFHHSVKLLGRKNEKCQQDGLLNLWISSSESRSSRLGSPPLPHHYFFRKVSTTCQQLIVAASASSLLVIVCTHQALSTINWKLKLCYHGEAETSA